MPKQHNAVRLSQRVLEIRPSNIRGWMKRTAKDTAEGKIVNLAQGLPQFPAAELLKMAGIDAIQQDRNQYADTWGHPPLREAVAAKYLQHYGMKVNPDTEVTITCGVSEAISDALLAIVNPGDEVIVLEPFYENYPPNITMALGKARYVKLRKPDWTFDEKELAAAFNKKTRAIIINTPHNPTGRVFTRQELEFIAALCQKWDVLAICDEIYEHMIYDGHKHIPLATLPGMENRTFTCSGLSKTFNVTGWRIGWVIAPAAYTDAIRRLHDYVTLAAPTPFQHAGLAALKSPPEFYEGLVRKYSALREKLSAYVEQAGLPFAKPQGTYFLFADSSALGFKNDRQAAEYFLKDVRVAVVSGFGFVRPRVHSNMIRFCFAKYPETLDAAGQRIITVTKQS